MATVLIFTVMLTGFWLLPKHEGFSGGGDTPSVQLAKVLGWCLCLFSCILQDEALDSALLSLFPKPAVLCGGDAAVLSCCSDVPEAQWFPEHGPYYVFLQKEMKSTHPSVLCQKKICIII